MDVISRATIVSSSFGGDPERRLDFLVGCDALSLDVDVSLLKDSGFLLRFALREGDVFLALGLVALTMWTVGTGSDLPFFLILTVFSGDVSLFVDVVLLVATMAETGW